MGTVAGVFIDQIRELAKEGYLDAQIAKELGISTQRVRAIARQSEIPLPIDSRHRIDVNEVIERTVNAYSADRIVTELVEENLSGLDASRIDGWIDDLISARSELNKLISLLRGINCAN